MSIREHVLIRAIQLDKPIAAPVESPPGLLTARAADVIMIFLAALLLAFTIYRAKIQCFTHDEGVTYCEQVRAPLIKILTYDTLARSNNHLLNTLLMKLLAAMFGIGEFRMRLPNVLAHAAYLVGSFLLVRRAAQPLLALCVFLILNTNPFMLDYFTLARGYGIELGCVMLSLYFAIRFVEARTLRLSLLLASTICGALAMLAQFSTADFYIALVMTLAIAAVWKVRRSSASPRRDVLRIAASLAAVSVVLAAIVYVPLSRVNEGELTSGAQTTVRWWWFWRVTVGSLIRVWLYDQPYAALVYRPMQGAVAVILILMATVVLWRATRADASDDWAAGVFVLMLLVISAAGTLLQGLLFGILPLAQRWALWFVPPFFVLLLEALKIAAASRNQRIVRVSMWSAAAIAVALTAHFLRAADPRYTFGNWWDTTTRNAMVDVQADYEANVAPKRNLVLSPNYAYWPALNFYRLAYNMLWIRSVSMKGPNIDADYYFYDERDPPLNRGELVELSRYQVARPGKPVFTNVLARKRSLASTQPTTGPATQPLNIVLPQSRLLMVVPNPLPRNHSPVQLIWNVGDGSFGAVYMSDNGAEETIVASSGAGSITLPDMLSNHRYAFHLYDGRSRKNLLASVDVAPRR